MVARKSFRLNSYAQVSNWLTQVPPRECGVLQVPPASSSLGRSLGRLYASVLLLTQLGPEAFHKPVKLVHVAPPGGSILDCSIRALETESSKRFQPSSTPIPIRLRTPLDSNGDGKQKTTNLVTECNRRETGTAPRLEVLFGRFYSD